ncbi:MAG: TetR/AcrR family transcriptional regulator [Flavitalea sp.]
MKKDESTEQKILSAAKKVFVAKGMSGARMQDIADEAGINKALLHYYFRNKEMLFETIFLELSTDFFPRLKMIFDSDDTLFTKIEKFCTAYIDNILVNPYIPIFVLNEIHQRPQWFAEKVMKAGAPNMAKLAKQVREEVKAGRIRPIHPAQLIMNMLSMCIFPFVARPMLMNLMGMDDPIFRSLMEDRKTEIPRFIMSSIKL